MNTSTGLEATIFYMDIRAFGKDFDQYYERARSKENIEYIKSMPSRVLQVPGLAGCSAALSWMSTVKPVERISTWSSWPSAWNPKPEISESMAHTGDRAQ